MLVIIEHHAFELGRLQAHASCRAKIPTKDPELRIWAASTMTSMDGGYMPYIDILILLHNVYSLFH